MKMQNMKIVQKWREYAGPKDERLEAENAKIYTFGFILLSFGMLALLAYQIIAQQVIWVHNAPTMRSTCSRAPLTPPCTRGFSS